MRVGTMTDRHFGYALYAIKQASNLYTFETSQSCVFVKKVMDAYIHMDVRNVILEDLFYFFSTLLSFNTQEIIR